MVKLGRVNRSKKGVWASQGKAVEALVLHDTSPREAKAVARAAYAAAR